MKETTEIKTPGFLLFFCISTSLGALYNIGVMFSNMNLLPVTLEICLAVIALLQIATVFIATNHSYKARFFQLAVLLVVIIYCVDCIAISPTADIIGQALGALVWPLIWLLYFCFSKKFEAYCSTNNNKAALSPKKAAATPISAPNTSAPSVPPQPIPQKLPNFCKHCGTILPEGENYCEICKRTLYPDPSEKLTPHYCKYCGAQYNAQATFCPDCKKRVRLFRKPTAAEAKNAVFYISIVLNLVFILLFVFMLNKPNTAAQQPVQAQPQQNTTTSNNSAVYNAAKERAAEAKKLKEEENYAAFVKAHEYHNGMVFVKESGNYTYYHFTQSCSAIRNDLTKSVHITTMRDKEPCPLCFK